MEFQEYPKMLPDGKIVASAAEERWWRGVSNPDVAMTTSSDTERDPPPTVPDPEPEPQIHTARHAKKR